LAKECTCGPKCPKKGTAECCQEKKEEPKPDAAVTQAVKRVKKAD